MGGCVVQCGWGVGEVWVGSSWSDGGGRQPAVQESLGPRSWNEEKQTIMEGAERIGG